MMASVTIVVVAVVVRRLVMMVTMMVMASLVIHVRVHKRSREGTNWGCKSHTQGRSKRKQPNHRPDKSDCPCACPFQPDQHGPFDHILFVNANGGAANPLLLAQFGVAGGISAHATLPQRLVSRTSRCFRDVWASVTSGGDAYDGGVHYGGDGRAHDDHRNDGDDDHNDGSEVARNSDGGVESDDDGNGHADGSSHRHSHHSGSEKMQV
jgi:hypothetical protein